jgi:cysteine desulfurase
MNAIYLDGNSTTPLDEQVLLAMLPYFRDRFGNPGSGHAYGRVAADAVAEARRYAKALLGNPEGTIVFTASATEANNQVLAAWIAGTSGPCHAITTAIEHKSVSAPLFFAEQRGGVSVTQVSPDDSGRIAPEALRAAIRPDTRLVSIVAASHVVHTINALGDLASICADRGILFHTDAAQLVGRVALDAAALPLDAVTFSAHKMYGPKGAAALFLSPRGLRAGGTPLIRGGGQESGLRAGTLNVPAIVGFGEACRLAAERQAADAVRCRALAGRLYDALKSRFPAIRLNGDPQARLPGGLNMWIPGIDAKGLIAAVPEVAFSDGAACDANDEPGYVLKAMGRPKAAHCSIRLQIGRETTENEIDSAAELLTAGIRRLERFKIDDF